MSKIFISWSKETKSIAEALKVWIHNLAPELDVWVSSKEILGGTKWREEIDNALESSDFAIVCIGPSALQSPWVLYEVGAIGHKKAVIPLNFHVSTNDTSAVLFDFQSIEMLSPATLVPNIDSIDQLLKSILSIAKIDDKTSPSDNDDAFLETIKCFAISRKNDLLEKLKLTKRSDTLLNVLSFIDIHKEHSPRDFSENKVLKDLLGKKYLVALSMFLLKDLGLVNIEDYDNITTGKVSLSSDGKLLQLA